jgi:hypothetical protein
MASNPGIRPDDVAGLAAAAVAMAAGIGAAGISEIQEKHLQAKRLEAMSDLMDRTIALGPGTHELQHLQYSEMKARFKEGRIYSYLFLIMIILFAIVFLYGGVSLVLGITAAHVVTVLASAIPGVSSALFKRASNIASKQADEAFKTLSKRVEDAEEYRQRETSLTRVQMFDSAGTLQTLEALKRILPDATPEQLTSIITSMPAITRNGEHEAITELERTILELESIYRRLVREVGEDHPDALLCRYKLSHAYLQVGNFSGASSLLRNLYDDCLRVFGEDNPLTKADYCLYFTCPHLTFHR